MEKEKHQQHNTQGVNQGLIPLQVYIYIYIFIYLYIYI